MDRDIVFNSAEKVKGYCQIWRLSFTLAKLLSCLQLQSYTRSGSSLDGTAYSDVATINVSHFFSKAFLVVVVL